MPADALLDMAKRACQRYIRSIDDIGGCPYEIVRSALLKIPSPEQLYLLEQRSPHIIGKDAEIWLSLIRRDFPESWNDNIKPPSDPANWHKVYRKMRRDLDRQNEAGEEQLKARLSGIKKEKEQNFVELNTGSSSLYKGGSSVIGRRARMVHNYNSGRTGAKGAHATTFFDKMRRQAGATRTAKTLNRPTHELKRVNHGITRAPQQFLEDIKVKNVQTGRPAVPIQKGSELESIGKIRAPAGHEKKAARPAFQPYDMTQDREARLRALKAGQSVTASTPSSNTSAAAARSKGPNRPNDKQTAGLSMDFLEDDDDDDQNVNNGKRNMYNDNFDDGGEEDDDDDDLFDDSTVQRQQQQPSASRHRGSLLASVVSPSRPGKRKEAPNLFHQPAKKLVMRTS